MMLGIATTYCKDNGCNLPAKRYYSMGSNDTERDTEEEVLISEEAYLNNDYSALDEFVVVTLNGQQMK